MVSLVNRFLWSKIANKYNGPIIKPPIKDTNLRHDWSSKLDFILACVGYAVGLGNIWRFPYLCYKNGGGAFLIPYLIIAATCGVPLFFLEIALGQLTGQGCITCWKLCPIFKGIGYGIVVLCTWLNVYYVVVLAWALYYFYESFSMSGELPWASCNNSWNTASCSLVVTKGVNSTDCAEEFWRLKVNMQSSGIDDVTYMNWGMVAALACAWIINYFIIWKGVKVSGKIVYFTALFPYLMLVILLIRGVTLPGAYDGLAFYLKTDFNRLLDAQVWLDAGTQIFFSYAVSTGALIAMGSYNKFSNNCYLDTYVICIINSATSFLSGFCIFSILGNMAYEQGKRVEDVVKDGPGLAFIAYPKALAQMPGSQFWSIVFFFMLILLGIDSEFVGLEGLFTALLDIKPSLRKGNRQEIIIAGACIISFIFGLLMCTGGGIYVFQLFDYYSASGFVLLWFCFFECIAIAWVYGGRRLYADLTHMLGFEINSWMLISWTFIAPITSVIIFVMSCVTHEPITMSDYVYPGWADGLGWVLALSSMICIPVYALYKFISSPGANMTEKWLAATRPEFEEVFMEAEILAEKDDLSENNPLDHLE